MQAKITKVLAKIRPQIQQDGGDIELVNFDQAKGRLEVRLIGACAHCPMAQITLKSLVESRIKEELPEVKEVVAV
ncbi:MAG: NifU family protein [Candidatus Buchananbacteria bacterium]